MCFPEAAISVNQALSQHTWLVSSAIVAMPSFKASPMKKIQAMNANPGSNKASKHTTKKNPVKAMKPLKGMKGMKAIKASKGKGSMESPKCRPQFLAYRQVLQEGSWVWSQKAPTMEKCQMCGASWSKSSM